MAKADEKKRWWRTGLHPLNWLYCGILVELQLALILFVSDGPLEALKTGSLVLAAMLLIPLASASLARKLTRSAVGVNATFALAVTVVQVTQLDRLSELNLNEPSLPPPPAMVYGEPRQTDPTRPHLFAEDKHGPVPAAGPVRTLDRNLLASNQHLLGLRHELMAVGYFDPATIPSYAVLAERAELNRNYREAAQQCLELDRAMASHLHASAGEYTHLLALESDALDWLQEVHELDLEIAQTVDDALRLLAENWNQWTWAHGEVRFTDETADRDFRRLEVWLLDLFARQSEREALIADRLQR